MLNLQNHIDCVRQEYKDKKDKFDLQKKTAIRKTKLA